MSEEWQPDAMVDIRLERSKRDLFEYIDKNHEKIDQNIAVFYGHVLTILENQFPGIGEGTHDRFIDEITVHLLEVSTRGSEIEYIEKLFNHATRMKRHRGGRMIFDIILGIRLIDSGKYTEAIAILEKFRTVDAIICTAIAYCYHILSTERHPTEVPLLPGQPRDMALRAREQLIELVRLHPPVNRLRFPQVIQDLRINKIFWFMMRLAIELFPDEAEYLRIGLEKAKKDGNRDMRGELLKIASERFFNDIGFLRDLYHFRIENRDASGAAAVVKQMMQQFPEEVEPIYYGLLLAIVSAQATAYQRFRKLAAAKQVPVHILLLLDFTFEALTGGKVEAFACLDDIKKRLSGKNHYIMLIEYVALDIFSEDEKRAKNAKKILIDSIDQYCMKTFRIPG